MAFKTKKTVLIYGFNEDEKASLERLLRENNLPEYKAINEAMTNVTLELILTIPSNMAKPSNTSNNEDANNKEAMIPIYDGKVVLFNKFQEDEVMKAMRAIKAGFSDSPIFAVVTPTSTKWKFKDLVEHLIEERNWYESQKNRV